MPEAIAIEIAFMRLSAAMSHWFELTVDVIETIEEPIASSLFEQGTTGVEHSTAAGRAAIKAYFPTRPDVDPLLRLCFDLSRSAEGSSFTISYSQIEQQDWSENWKLHFNPVRIEGTFFIHPPWIEPESDSVHSILIDPGMAFGTGQHATTRGCLTLIKRHAPTVPLDSALDLGTGSGVLAIALCKLGVSTVWAVDNDPTALQCAIENAQRNGVSLAIGASLSELKEPVGIIVANLFSDLLCGLAEGLHRSLREHGIFICSGFLTSDEKRVRQAFTTLGMVQLDRFEEGDWVSLAFTREQP